MPKEKTKRKYFSNDRKSRFFSVSSYKRHHKPLKEENSKSTERFVDEGDIFHRQKSTIESTEGKQHLSSLQKVFAQKLLDAKFRLLNEELYLKTGSESQEYFKDNKESFLDYHKGYQDSLERWPSKPVDKMISYLNKKPKHLIVGDFGCGMAKIAQSVKQQVHSFDFIALNEHVTACDMSHVPLEPDSIDIAIFCLSLMGTNYIDYLMEANRVLKMDGTLKIAEVESRFISELKFQDLLRKIGFSMEKKSKRNGYFLDFEFKKVADVNHKPNSDPSKILKPCLYKRR